MNNTEARAKLEDQMKKILEKEKELEESMKNLQDFKLKVRGGLETLDMLEAAEPKEINNTET
jgi:cell division protein FtsB